MLAHVSVNERGLISDSRPARYFGLIQLYNYSLIISLWAYQYQILSLGNGRVFSHHLS